MKGKLIPRCVIVLAIAALLSATLVSAQSSDLRKKALTRAVQAFDKLSPAQKALLSSGKQNFLRSAKRELSAPPHATNSLNTTTADRVGPSLLPPSAMATTGMPTTTTATSTTTNGVIIVSNPSLDFANSALGGFRQSTSSSARCGNSVVVGFGDTEDAVRISSGNPFFFSPFESFDGVSVSSDGGQSFADLGHIGSPNIPPNEFEVLEGDPVVACSNANRFYYAAPAVTTTFDQGECLPGCPFESVSISKSNDGGHTWTAPAPAFSLSGFDFAIDRPWLAVDPTNSQRLYVTFTDFLSGNLSTTCFANESRIELVTSSDGGNTWTAPVVVDDECPDPNTGLGNLVTGSNVIVSPQGAVYVAYELFSQVFGFPGTSPPQIVFQKSLDHGQTFTNKLKVSDVGPIGAGAFNRILQTLILADEFPMLAVDRSNTPSRGTLYVAWSDGRENVRLDSFSGAYAYSDVFVAKSSDAGSSFTVLPRISPTPSTFKGPGRDQFLPGIAVDRNGEVAVCYYDRRNDPTNMAIDRYCSISFNQGQSWEDLRASSPGWVPLNLDPLPFADNSIPIISPFFFTPIDYDSLTTDFLLANPGFFGAFQFQVNGNPNIVATKF